MRVPKNTVQCVEVDDPGVVIQRRKVRMLLYIRCQCGADIGQRRLGKMGSLGAGSM